jgi:hypothetical protein
MKTTHIGAAFYSPAVDMFFTVNPSGMNETDTIIRAELAAIWASLYYDSGLTYI